MAIGVPKYVDSPLTPPPSVPPSERAKKLLRQVSDSAIKSGQTFSVTNSPLLCPDGKNYLYVLRPYMWETKPGCFDCDKPQGVKQLQQMATTVYALAFASTCLPKADEYRQEAEKLLRVFFLDPDTMMKPEILYAQCCPGQCPKGDKTFVVAAMAVLRLSPEVEDGMRRWIATHTEWMATSEQGKDAQSSGNNLTMWYNAEHVTHLAVNCPGDAAQLANNHLARLAQIAPADLFAPELQRTRPRHYVLFTLEPLFILAGVGASAAGAVPDASVVGWLHTLVEYATTVPASELEKDSDNDPRYALQLAWFRRILARWSGQPVEDADPDGSQWEGGWNQRARLSWALI